MLSFVFLTISNRNFYFSVKPFSQSAYPGGKPATAVSSGEVGGLQAPPPPPWEGRAIATHKLRLVEFSAFMEQNRDPDTYQKHLFVHIGGPAQYADPLLEVSFDITK